MQILNFGSLNIDFTYAVDHIATPGETIASTSLAVNPGGKGLNQSIALARAGAKVAHAGMVGIDGGFLVDLLRDNGVDVSAVRTSEDVRTGNAIIQTDVHGENCIVLYGGANQAIDEAFIDEVLAGTQTGDWILLQNEISGLGHLVEAAHARGLRVILNPSPITDDLLALDFSAVDMLILNEVEAAALIGVGCASSSIAQASDSTTVSVGAPTKGQADDQSGLIAALRARFADQTVVLTLGEKGSVYIDAGGGEAVGGEESAGWDDVLVRQPAFPVEAVDTTAAGDTFTGYLLAALAAGEVPATAMRLAAAASALAVTRPGAAPSIPTRPEVDAFLEQVASLT